MYAYLKNAVWTEWQGQHMPLLADPISVLPVPLEWNDNEKRGRFGLFRVQEQPVPTGMRVIAYELEDNDGRPRKLDTLAPIPADVPERVSARQFRRQLRRAGLLPAVKAWVASKDGETQDSFEYSDSFVRSDPMMQQGFAELGFTPHQIDEFFVAASRIR